MDSSVSFEKAIARLEEIIKKLESGELSLDDSLSLYEESMQLTQLCKIKLVEAENRVEKIENSFNEKDLDDLKKE